MIPVNGNWMHWSFYDQRMALYRMSFYNWNLRTKFTKTLSSVVDIFVTVLVVEKVPVLLERKPISNALCISSTKTRAFSWWHHRFDISILMAAWVAASHTPLHSTFFFSGRDERYRKKCVNGKDGILLSFWVLPKTCYFLSLFPFFRTSATATYPCSSFTESYT